MDLAMLSTIPKAWFGIGAALLGVLIWLLWFIFHNPYSYPYYFVDIDISKRRNVNIQEEIEKYLLDKGMDEFLNQFDYVEQWESDTFEAAKKSIFRFKRVKQYLDILDDDNMFIFNLCRDQTRYRQRNYVKSSYVVSAASDTCECNLAYLQARYHELERIGFETTTVKYHAKNQRQLMTPELRRRIMERDNYTCRVCGKYMPDEVGLHIDHIIPVSRGGKTVESNLQVLCSKCNGHKSNRV